MNRSNWKVLVATLTVLAATESGAVVVQFENFSSTSGLTLSGSSAGNVNNGIDPNPVLRLVQSTTSQTGSAFSSTQINASSFSTSFDYRLTNPGGIVDLSNQSGADGFVFVVQPVSASIGGLGGGLGYSGVSPSVGIEFDTFHNSFDPDTNHVGINVNGNVDSNSQGNTAFVSPRFDDGNLWSAWVDYDGATLEVRTNQTGVRPVLALISVPIDIESIIGQPTAFVGFAAGTGSAYANHDIVSWEYRDSFDPIDAPVPTVPEPGVLALLCVGLSSLAFVTRRRTKPA